MHISSPSDQNVLVYNASNARFELASQQFQECLLTLDNNVSSTNSTLAVDSKISDTANLCTIESNGHFTLIDGTYLIWCWTRKGSNTSGSAVRMASQSLNDPTGDSGGDQEVLNAPGNILDGLAFFGKVIVGSGNRDGTFRVKHSASFAPNTTSGTIPNITFLRILKVA